MPHLKTEAPPDVVEIVGKAEAQADGCWRSLQILTSPSNVAIWALLTGGIEKVEREQAARGSNTPHFDAMLANLSRLLAIAVKWAMTHGQPAISPLAKSWTHALAAAVNETLSVATQYSHFEVCFQGIHKNRYAVDVITPTTLRFSVPGSERDRQVSAYQKGHRPREGRFAGRRAAQQPQNPRVRDAAEGVIRGCLDNQEITAAGLFASAGPIRFFCGYLSTNPGNREAFSRVFDRIRMLQQADDDFIWQGLPGRRWKTFWLGSTPIDDIRDSHVPLFVAQGSRDDTTLCADLFALEAIRQQPQRPIQYVVLQEDSHSFQTPDARWRVAEMFDDFLSWALNRKRETGLAVLD